MKGKDLIRLIKEKELEDFEIQVVYTDGYDKYPTFNSLSLKGIADIGVSDQIVYLDGEEEE